MARKGDAASESRWSDWMKRISLTVGTFVLVMGALTAGLTQFADWGPFASKAALARESQQRLRADSVLAMRLDTAGMERTYQLNVGRYIACVVSPKYDQSTCEKILRVSLDSILDPNRRR